MKIDALIFVLVQVLTTNFQRHLFYIIFTKQINPNFTLIGEGFGFIFYYNI